jgi:hypothetical protein
VCCLGVSLLLVYLSFFPRFLSLAFGQVARQVFQKMLRAANLNTGMTLTLDDTASKYEKSHNGKAAV